MPLCCDPSGVVIYTDSYHLHVTTLEVAFETSGGGWLMLVVVIATAIAIVVDVVDGNFLLGVHDCSEKELRRQGRKAGGKEGSRKGMKHTTRTPGWGGEAVM